MVLISSKKYACETCIKGHRSSSCKHTDRPLFEIKKKGRPVTQCEHCRELRKTKQVHVKCICTKAEGTSSKGSTKTLESAAFPNGLPEALEASVALQLLSEGTSSDSDHAGGCTCHLGGECHCCVPRKSAPRRRRKEASDPGPHSGATTPPITLPTASHATLSRIAELRPVLPKPIGRRFDHEGPIHEPSSSSHNAHGTTRHHHDSTFSPYGRAYDYTHQSFIPETPMVSGPDLHPVNSLKANPLSTTSSPSPGEPISGGNTSRIDGQLSFGSGDMNEWSTIQSTGDFLRSLCGCSDGCRCQGCTTSSTTSDPSGACHTNRACGGCLNCAALAAIPFSDLLPPNTALSIHSSASRDANRPRDAIDEWARRVGSFAGAADTSALPSPFDVAGYPQGSQQSNAVYFPSSATEEFTAGFQFTQTHGGYRSSGCRCPPGLCECHNSSGCGCDGCQAGLSFPTNLNLPVSQERGSCCGATGERRDSPLDVPMSGIPATYDQFTGYISMPDGFPVTGERMGMGMRSRSSSSSSSSASGSSHFSIPNMLQPQIGRLSAAGTSMPSLSSNGPHF
ncbi:copper-binding transcription factor [Paramarasmius palmivorus]|uniref:Copper-binding transcription factor n=1 Tax=Paramarasmius palmivorus TaxID=297713 RepID=A0AAW0BRS7_9AGAR